MYLDRVHSTLSLTGLATGQVNGRANDRVNGRATGRVTGRATGRANGRVTGRTTGRATARANGRVTGQATGRATGQVIGRATGRANGRVAGRATGRRWKSSGVGVHGEHVLRAVLGAVVGVGGVAQQVAELLARGGVADAAPARAARAHGVRALLEARAQPQHDAERRRVLPVAA